VLLTEVYSIESNCAVLRIFAPKAAAAVTIDDTIAEATVARGTLLPAAMRYTIREKRDEG
jgi:hypothetical protein